MSVDLPVSGRGMSPINERASLLIVIVYQALSRVGETIRVFFERLYKNEKYLKKKHLINGEKPLFSLVLMRF